MCAEVAGLMGWGYSSSLEPRQLQYKSLVLEMERQNWMLFRAGFWVCSGMVALCCALILPPWNRNRNSVLLYVESMQFFTL